MMETVVLRNGAEEAEPLVVVTMSTLRLVMKERPLALYDLVMRCRDNNYKFFGGTGGYLVGLALINAGHDVHDSIKNIVLSAVEGDGMDMVLRSPVAKEE
jgi:hypothetical protein